MLLGLAGCASVPGANRADDICRLVPLAQMPLEIRANLLFVWAKINDEPVTLLVDSGAERTLLTEATVDRLRLPRDTQHATRTFGIGNPTTTWDAKLPHGIVLGTTRFPVDTVTVGRFDINQGPDGITVDGLLGADILLAFDIDLDLPAHLVTFYRGRRGCSDAAPPWKGPHIEISGVTTWRDRLLLPFRLDGVSGVAVLDTGAQVSSISRSMAERMGLAAAMAEDRTVMAHGASPNQVPVHVHRFRELNVGPAVINGPVLPIVPMAAGLSDGLIGVDFLRSRRAWLSFSTQQIFVTPLQEEPRVAAGRSNPIN